ncbi:MAG TPA: glycosyltransferase 87 family protein [Streptosporangiaceae bacterium]|nr:glycosyltransferase 87 family protein [Streptosporangiaceae bacterium]
MGIVRRVDRRLLIAGAVAFLATAACYLVFILGHAMDRWLAPVDLYVYRLGGDVVAQLAPGYRAGVAAPLYDWPGYGLKFTYTPFAAVVFAVLALPAWGVVQAFSVIFNVLAFLATIWVTLGALGYRVSLARVGSMLLLAAVLFWTEPVQRTLYLGQVELLLMALVMWDMCQPDRRSWKGAGVGLAAGIKLVPLIFIPYLLLTRRYRQAGVAAGTFLGTVLVGFAVRPADSRLWWLHGLFVKGSRTGFVGWEGNQSLQGLITRLAGSIAAGQPIWLAVAAVTLVAGLLAAAVVARAGYPAAGIVTCALTALLVSPISWDHHWVWIVPGVTILACLGLRARGRVRWAWFTGAALVTGLFGAWPGFLWGQPIDLGAFSEGFIWAPPNTPPGTFARLGDLPSYAEYHWSGWQLVSGNLYVLTGIAVLVVIIVLAVRSRPARRRAERAPAGADKPVPVVSR